YQYNRVDFTQPIDQTFGIPITYTATARAGIFRYFVPDPANPLVIAGQTITRNNPPWAARSGNPAAGLSAAATATSLRWARPDERGPVYAWRFDHNFNANNSMFGRYLFSDYNTLKGDPLNGRPQVYPNGPPLGEVFRRTSNLAISYRRVLSPRVVNELTLGYGRFGFLFSQGEANPKWPDVPPFDFPSISESYITTQRTTR